VAEALAQPVHYPMALTMVRTWSELMSEQPQPCWDEILGNLRRRGVLRMMYYLVDATPQTSPNKE
jgi:hypothetical protein